MVWYFKEIFPIFILTSIIIWFLNLICAFQLIINGFKPIVGLLGLPGDASPIFILGFFRRDYGAAGLYDMQGSLSMVQLTVAAVTLTLFVPCIAQLLIMIKERGSKTAILIFLFVLFMAFFVGFLLNFILTQLGVTL
jgi:ferrous iron transport protein B